MIGVMHVDGRHLIAWAEWQRMSAGGRLSFAWAGVRVLLDELCHRGVGGGTRALALAPFAALYVVGSVMRDGMRSPARTGTRAPSPDRRSYLRRRYRGSQRLVDWRERRLVASLLARVGPARRALDVPCGYGRFAPVLDAAVSRQLVCADIDGPRLRALRDDAGESPAPPVVQADLRGALPFATGAFDLVFNLRYLHHAHGADEPRRALAELARVSARWVVLSYYRRSNVHAVVRDLQEVTRANRRRGPVMLGRHEVDGLLREAGLRVVRDAPILPWVHAQRLVLAEKRPGF